MASLDICSWLPVQLWSAEEAEAHDQRFWDEILSSVPRGALLLLDLGFTNFIRFAQLSCCTLYHARQERFGLPAYPYPPADAPHLRYSPRK